MKRKITWLLGVAALIATAFALSKFPLQESKTIVASHHQQAKTLHPKSACQIFTPERAKDALTFTVRRIDTPSTSQTSTEDIRISTCTYQTTDKNAATASLTTRAALHRSAYQTNVSGFQSTRTAATERGLDTHTSIGSRYHVAAYYNPTFKQLNILTRNGQYWLIVQADGGKHKTEQLAQVFLNQLSSTRNAY